MREVYNNISSDFKRPEWHTKRRTSYVFSAGVSRHVRRGGRLQAEQEVETINTSPGSESLSPPYDFLFIFFFKSRLDSFKSFLKSVLLPCWHTMTQLQHNFNKLQPHIRGKIVFLLQSGCNWSTATRNSGLRFNKIWRLNSLRLVNVQSEGGTLWNLLEPRSVNTLRGNELKMFVDDDLNYLYFKVIHELLER